MNKKALLLNAAVVGLFSTSVLAQTAAAPAAATVNCTEKNSCKGKGSCKGAKNECKGKNSCGGHVYTAASAEACTKAGGTVTK